MTRAVALAMLCVVTVAAIARAQSKTDCGEVVTIQTHDRTTTRYAFARPTAPAPGEPIAVVLLPGGGGHLDLDANGCPRALKGNSLVRSIPEFRNLGFATALVDSPSDHVGDDGLGGFRSSSQHADDLGKVIADVRARANGLVWVIGTSRGTISAVNAASRLSGASAPDGLVLTSALMSGAARGARKPWATQSVFDLPLGKIRMPVLVVGHAADACLRSPATMMDAITARTNGVREQIVTVTGGPGIAGTPASLDACEGRMPHGFVDQEAAVAAGIARFIRGGSYQ